MGAGGEAGGGGGEGGESLELVLSDQPHYPNDKILTRTQGNHSKSFCIALSEPIE